METLTAKKVDGIWKVNNRKVNLTFMPSDRLMFNYLTKPVGENPWWFADVVSRTDDQVEFRRVQQ